MIFSAASPWPAALDTPLAALFAAVAAVALAEAQSRNNVSCSAPAYSAYILLVRKQGHYISMSPEDHLGVILHKKPWAFRGTQQVGQVNLLTWLQRILLGRSAPFFVYSMLYGSQLGGTFMVPVSLASVARCDVMVLDITLTVEGSIRNISRAVRAAQVRTYLRTHWHLPHLPILAST